MNNLIDINQQLDNKRKTQQLDDGVCHSKNYESVQFIDDDYPIENDVLIEVYAGNNIGLCISSENDSKLITLTQNEAIQLANDILLASSWSEI